MVNCAQRLCECQAFYHHILWCQRKIGLSNANIVDLTTEDIGHFYSWNEVSEIHRVRHGIYQRSGHLISLLTDFGKINPCYPDFHGDSRDVIHYTGNGRRGDQNLDTFNQALLDAVKTAIAVPLFNKHAPGKWEYMGHWRVADGKYVFDESQRRMVWKFTLQREDD